MAPCTGDLGNLRFLTWELFQVSARAPRAEQQCIQTYMRFDGPTLQHADNTATKGKEVGRKFKPRMLFPGSILGECKASARAESQCIQTYMRFEHADNAAIV